MQKHRTLTHILLATTLLFAATTGGLIWQNTHTTKQQTIVTNFLTNKKIVHSNTNKANVFTSPVLDCENVEQGDETVIPRPELATLIESLKKKYAIDFISVYFRDLNNGPWLGLNEKEFFSPASLIKMPYFIALLHYSEKDPSILYTRVTVTAEDVQAASLQNVAPVNPLVAGSTYTLKEIAKRTITDSDNTGLFILMKHIPQKYLDDIYTTLGNIYAVQSSEDSNLWIRVKDVGSLFRILYNASYLTRENSEYALSIFAQSKYINGLVAGVPKNVVVAHKFGERIDTIDQGGVKTVTEQIHDCGIVYYPTKPYILCVMTRGHNINTQASAIVEISRFFYKKIAQ